MFDEKNLIDDYQTKRIFLKEYTLVSQALEEESTKKLVNTCLKKEEQVYRKLNECTFQLLQKDEKFKLLYQSFTYYLQELGETLEKEKEKTPDLDLPDNVSVGYYRLLKEKLEDLCFLQKEILSLCKGKLIYLKLNYQKGIIVDVINDKLIVRIEKEPDSFQEMECCIEELVFNEKAGQSE
jgi:hypothetical protein